MSVHLHLIPSTLPCFPCPHHAVCCSWGTSLTVREAEALKALYGESCVVWDAEDDEWRTRVDNGRCMFLRDSACTLHDRPEYPSVCRGFPWSDPEGGPYKYDLSICPELEAAEAARQDEPSV